MTGYHIKVGYNGAHSKSEVQDALRTEVKKLCAAPEKILAEVARIEGFTPEQSYAESYREPWQDLTIKILEADEEKEQEFQVMQCASGYGEQRGFKESMRRAFCRLILEAMHRHGMEISVIVA